MQYSYEEKLNKIQNNKRQSAIYGYWHEYNDTHFLCKIMLFRIYLSMSLSLKAVCVFKTFFF